MKKMIWLHQHGKTIGPLTAAELQAIRDSGEYRNYNWLWEASAKQWSAINPPPVPEGALEAPAPSSQPGFVAHPSGTASGIPSGASSPLPAKAPSARELTVPLQAICYDERHVLSGTVRRVSGDRFFLVTADHVDSLPHFKAGTQVWVNLLNEPQGLTENVQVRIAELQRLEDSTWAYAMKWKSRPGIFGT
jgi:hypothetical protein